MGVRSEAIMKRQYERGASRKTVSNRNKKDRYLNNRAVKAGNAAAKNYSRNVRCVQRSPSSPQ